MNKEVLEKRLSELRNTLDQIQANGNATLGAIRECEYWLNIIKNEAGENPAQERQNENKIST